MQVDLKTEIVAAVTLNPDRVSGGIPTFHAKDQADLEKIAIYLAKATMGAIHDLENGTYIIVKH